MMAYSEVDFSKKITQLSTQNGKTVTVAQIYKNVFIHSIFKRDIFEFHPGIQTSYQDRNVTFRKHLRAVSFRKHPLPGSQSKFENLSGL